MGRCRKIGQRVVTIAIGERTANDQRGEEGEGKCRNPCAGDGLIVSCVSDRATYRTRRQLQENVFGDGHIGENIDRHCLRAEPKLRDVECLRACRDTTQSVTTLTVTDCRDISSSHLDRGVGHFL